MGKERSREINRKAEKEQEGEEEVDRKKRVKRD